MKKISSIMLFSGLLILLLLWGLIEFALSSDCRKMNRLMSNEKERAAVINFLNKISRSPTLADFLKGTRGQLFSFAELPDLNVDIPDVLSYRYDHLNLYIMTDQSGKGFSEKYNVLELGIGTPSALLVFNNGNSDFSFGSEINQTEVGIQLYSPKVKCTESKR